jgi:hypothetical protein
MLSPLFAPGGDAPAKGPRGRSYDCGGPLGLRDDHGGSGPTNKDLRRTHVIHVEVNRELLFVVSDQLLELC